MILIITVIMIVMVIDFLVVVFCSPPSMKLWLAPVNALNEHRGDDTPDTHTHTTLQSEHLEILKVHMCMTQMWIFHELIVHICMIHTCMLHMFMIHMFMIHMYIKHMYMLQMYMVHKCIKHMLMAVVCTNDIRS